jgi:DNA (cytosine-5)-methyltransferase 1
MGRPIKIELDGLGETVETDIRSDAKTRKPRGHFRERTPFRRFFRHHQVKAGQQVVFERLNGRRYRLSLDKPQRNGDSRPTAAEFFAGIGLVRLALERQGWQVMFANDIDRDKAEMYRHNWPNDNHLKVEDIHKLDPDEIPTCDLFTASFPCNDLSIAGRWEGLNGKESSAFWGFVRILKEMGDRRPRLVLIENVVGFLMSHGGKDFAQALSALNELGYSVDAMILNAVHWTPQSRARLFVVATLDRAVEPSVFQIQTDARPEPLTRFIVSHSEISWNLRPLPSLPKPKKQLKDIVDDLPDSDAHWWNAKRAQYFMNQLSDRHMEEARRMIEANDVTYATAFRRVRHGRSMAELRTDGIAGCLRTPRGGSGRQILFKAGKGKYQVRLLTARECARLQGVPETFKINVPLNRALFGFGDAVCVPTVEWIVKHYLTPLAAKIAAPTLFS